MECFLPMFFDMVITFVGVQLSLRKKMWNVDLQGEMGDVLVSKFLRHQAIFFDVFVECVIFLDTPFFRLYLPEKKTNGHTYLEEPISSGYPAHLGLTWRNQFLLDTQPI